MVCLLSMRRDKSSTVLSRWNCRNDLNELVLEFNKYLVVVEVIYDLAEDYVFHRLTGNTCSRDWSIVGWVSLVSFFKKTAVTLTLCQSLGTLPVLNDC